MNLQTELLSLVEMTKAHLLEKHPHLRKRKERPLFVKQEMPKARPILPEPQKPASPPLELQKEPILEKKPLELKPRALALERDYQEIKELLKKHCPFLKLKSPILILFDESPEEKKLLGNLAGALQKEGFQVELIPASQFDPSKIQGVKAILADQLHCESLHCAQDLFFQIPSVAQLVQNPLKRHDIWKQLLGFLKK